ncbi:hypothetical protein BSH53_21710 [Salmonella enterica]|nr:hypothetical protein [Salmonella enterica]
MSQKIDMFSLLRKHAAHIASKKDWFSDTKKTMPSLIGRSSVRYPPSSSLLPVQPPNVGVTRLRFS